MSEYERESPTIHSDSPEDFSNHTFQEGKKKMIKKEKKSNTPISAAKLSKEERMRIQKEKNREAAQRSRDQHKEYVNNLQKQLKELKEELEKSRRYCYHCRQALEPSDCLFEGVKNEEISSIALTPELDEEKVEVGEQQQEYRARQEEDITEYFLRNRAEDEGPSYINYMLFIALVVIAVIFMPSRVNMEDSNRNLLQVYRPPSSEPIQDDFTIMTVQKLIDNMPKAFELVTRNSFINQKCLDSLQGSTSFSLTNLRSQSYHHQQQGILLCSFEQPKIPRSIHQGAKSPLLSLFLLGAEIKQMALMGWGAANWPQRDIQLNGIYKVAAQIKNVELIPQHQCLL